MTSDKILGTFLGIAIGDSLGAPAEKQTALAIKEKYGRIEKYITNTWTDDTQLSLAVATALIKSGGIDFNSIANEHILAFKESVKGWGSTSREAVARLAEGVSYNESGLTENPNRGFGNGVVMKMAPLALYLSLTKSDDWYNNVVDFARITHRQPETVLTAVIHRYALNYCLKCRNFQQVNFLKNIDVDRFFGTAIYPAPEIAAKLKLLESYEEFDTERTITELVGNCNAVNSLAFTYMFFLRSPTIEGLYDCVNAGADCDTNGSIFGGMLGALYGASIFPKHLVDGLDKKEVIFDVAERFSKTFLKR